MGPASDSGCASPCQLCRPSRSSWLATTCALSVRAASGAANARSQHPAPSAPAIEHSDPIRSGDGSITSKASACQ
ncbi:Uncharacterised protein [Mycobacterium tuberculosis]|nr:Uncharacterised protein [Mycobacterium tuberculosis]